MANVSLSQLTSVQNNTGTDLLEISKEDQNSVSGYVSRKTTAANLADYANTTKTYSGLTTTSQTIVGSLNECFQSVSDGKTLIAAAITDKGVQTATTDSFADMATNIGLISGGGITPTGTINISTNGVHDVTQYASANVSVSGGGGYPSRTLTFNSDTVYNIKININALFFKNASRTLSVSVNGGTATTLTSTIPLSLSGEESFIIQDDCIVGSNTIEVLVSNSDIYISKIETYDEYDLPAFIDGSGADSNTSFDRNTGISTTTIGTDVYKTSASSFFNISYSVYPNRPFDRKGNGTQYDCWMSAAGEPQWLQLELPSATYMTKFVMQNGNGSSWTQCPKDVVFQGSNDGSTWDNLESFIFSDTSAYNVTKTISPLIVGNYKYYRWYCQTVNNCARIFTLNCSMAHIYFRETW